MGRKTGNRWIKGSRRRIKSGKKRTLYKISISKFKNTLSDFYILLNHILLFSYSISKFMNSLSNFIVKITLLIPQRISQIIQDLSTFTIHSCLYPSFKIFL